MSTIFVEPMPFTVGSNSGWAATNPVAMTNLDHPGLVARSTGVTASFTVNLGASQTIDTIAIVGSNLPAEAVILITANTYISGATPAFVGSKAANISTKSIFMFAPVTTSSVTVNINVPAGKTIEFQRLVIGKRIEIAGMDQNCERTFDDQSVIESGPGWVSVEKYKTLPGWKIKASWITDAQWRSEFEPMLTSVGQSSPILFVPVADDPARVQHEATFGRLTGVAKGDHSNYDNWIVSFGITALAP